MSRPARIVIILATVPIVGTLGLMLVEGWGFLDALYMAVITITTVGFHEVQPLSTAGRMFVLLYLVAGIGVFLYSAAQIGELIVRAELHQWLGKRRMDSALKSQKDHFIICGAGRMGWSVAKYLAEKNLRFVVVDRDEDVLRDAQQAGWHWIEGDATDDRVLENAHIQQARGLAAILSSDADNLYVVMSARLLNSELQIISRATDEKAAQKMRKAGANRVISLFYTGAMKMAHLLTRPTLEDFFEIFTTQGGELDLAEIHVGATGPYVNLTLGETDFSRRGVIIVGIRRGDGQLILPAGSSTRIQPDDRLLALGNADALAEAS